MSTDTKTENPFRPEKVAVVAEVRERFEEAEAVLLTDYRGLDVPAISELRAALREAGGEYKIYKNTLVRRAVADLDVDLNEMLLGPTAIAFVTPSNDSPGDPAAVAKALKEFAKAHEQLTMKGGLLGDKAMSPAEIEALADLPSRDQLFAELAGSMEYMLQEFVGLLDAKLAEFARAGEELLDKGVLVEGSASAATETPDEAATETAAPDSASTESELSESGEAESPENVETSEQE